jgi:hypothetical protein
MWFEEKAIRRREIESLLVMNSRSLMVPALAIAISTDKSDENS